MAYARKFVAVATVIATGAVIALQGGTGVAVTKAAARDGGPARTAQTVDKSQTPLAVRDHSAKLVGRLSRAQRLRVTLGIEPSDEAGAEQYARAVQDRSSALYRHFLTATEWNSRFSPTKASEQKVVDWVRARGLTVTKRYPNRLLVDIDGTAAQLESAFGVTLNDYTLNGRSVFSNDRDPVVPSALRSIVTSVGGLDNVATLTSAAGGAGPSTRYSAGPQVQAAGSIQKNGSQAKLDAAMRAKKGNVPAISNGNYDPTDIYTSQAYDEDALHKQSNCCNPFHNPSTQSPAQTSIAIISAGVVQSSDVLGFQAAYPYLAVSGNFINVGGTPTSGDYEGTMDFEWAMSLANSFGCFCDTAHIWMYDGVNAAFSTFDSMYNQVLTDNHAKVVSSSWGCAEIYCTPDATMNTDHAIFNSMIAQGFTLLNSSGDRGAYADCSHVSVSFPASDTNWLAIGATNLELNSSSQYVSQTAWGDVGNCAGNGGGTGGGCSAKYAAPAYQSSISSFCGSTAKALPDVSLNGDWFNSPQNVYYGGSFSGNGGTSISAPMFAGFMAQVNSYGLELGNICGGGTLPCSPIGQAGTQLYLAANTHAAQGKNAFYDITSGSTTNEIGAGFNAIPGYDRASGWGTPNMLQLAWAMNYWNMPEASAPLVTLSGPSTSGWVTGGTISWSIVDQGSPASGVSGYTAQWDADPGDPSSAATPGSGNSFYTGPASAHGATSGSTGVVDGCHTLYVRAWDNIGESAVSTYGPVCVDATKPTIDTVPKVSLIQNSTVTANDVPVKITWTGSDSQSGVKNYRLQESLDGGAYSNVGALLTTTSKVLSLPAGHAYRFRVRATDNVGNTSTYKLGKTFHVNLYEENNGAIAYTTGWTRIAQAGASAGHVKEASLAGKKATFTFSGTQVGFVTNVASTNGSATIAIDGGSAATVNTHATGGPGIVRFVKLSGGPGSHTLVLTVSGTAGHPKIDVDAFAVIS
ncbi:MAG TPA: protease pro-enzyme activation domain-containing protein [Acidimicrobiia bacterium]|nr:protease pro-enzyme activation domain-containing protein [Acidimicrobiia bacterium]